MRYGEELRLRLRLMEEQTQPFMNMAGAFSQMFPTMQNPMYNALDNTRSKMSAMQSDLLEHEFNFGSVIHENYLDEYGLIRKVKELTKDDSIEVSEIVWMESVDPKERIDEKQIQAISHRLAWHVDDAIKFSRPAVDFTYHPNYGIDQESILSIPSMGVEYRHRASRGVSLRIGLTDFISEINKQTGLSLTYEEWIAPEVQEVRDDWMRCAPKSLSKIRHALFDHYKDLEYHSADKLRELYRKCDYINNDMSRTLTNWPTSKHEDAYNRARSDYRRYYFKLKELGLENLWTDVEITEPPTQENNDAS